MYEPCQCKGTIAYSHISCIENWIRVSGRVHCSICHSMYKNVMVEKNYLGLLIGVGILYVLHTVSQYLPFPLCFGFVSSGIQVYRKVKVPNRDYISCTIIMLLFRLNSWDVSLINLTSFFNLVLGGLGFLKFMLYFNPPCIRI